MTNDPAEELPPLIPPTWAIALAFAIVYFSWGTTYMATSIAMKEEHMPPALFGGIRLSLAGAMLLVCQYARGQSLRLSGGEFLRLLLVSWFYFLSANYLIHLGQQRENSGVAAILIATTPLWMGLFGMFWPQGERLSRRGWLGLLIGFAGIVLTKLDDGLDLLKDRHALFILGSAASWAMGSHVSRQLALKIPHLTSAGFQMLLGGLSQVVLGSATGEWGQFPGHLSNRALASFLYVLVFGSLLGFVAFNWLLGHIPVAKVGTYAYVNPVIAVFVGWWAGEVVHAWILAGIAVILIGVYLVRGDHAPSSEIELEPD
jgi:drug/metabolite transporter (DMT)-like permease